MASIIDIHFPEDQQEGTEATVTRWLVAEGDLVAAHDPVVEIETDKVVVEVAAPEAGRIATIKIQQDEEANPGDVLVHAGHRRRITPAENLSQKHEATGN